MPTFYEIFFWIFLLIGTIALLLIVPCNDPPLFISKYSLDRINGNKY